MLIVFYVAICESSFQMVIEGEGAGKLPCDETNLCCVGLKAAFEAAGKEVV